MKCIDAVGSWLTATERVRRMSIIGCTLMVIASEYKADPVRGLLWLVGFGCLLADIGVTRRERKERRDRPRQGS